MSRPERALRAARPAVAGATVATHPGAAGAHVLLVDLNNFASFPTLAIGILVASLRDRGHRVRVLSPLAHDVPAALRERRETVLDHVARRIHLSDWAPARGLRDALRGLRREVGERPHPVVLREVTRALDALQGERPDVVLLSAYLQHRPTVAAIGLLAAARGVPVLLGGPMFNVPDVAQAWLGLPGLTAVVGAEVDRSLPELLNALRAGDSLEGLPGVMTNQGAVLAAPPLRRLDDTPMPDFTDFPWDRYPIRIVPMMTGRGCQWDRCTFCSDVVSVSGRTFRTRSVEHVLREMQEQARRHGTANFLFLDLKLNSNPAMLRGISAGAQRAVRGAEWIGTVHVDGRADNGLSRRDLDAAVAGGMRRISFGLETGSQRLLELMRKGSTVEDNARFIRDAHAAGLSVRCTMFKGFPGETASDMARTADFLEAHAPFLDRVRFNDFSIQSGTPIHEAVLAGTVPELTARRPRAHLGRLDYHHADRADRAYRRAKARALAAVFAINGRPLRHGARQFDGLM